MLKITYKGICYHLNLVNRAIKGLPPNCFISDIEENLRRLPKHKMLLNSSDPFLISKKRLTLYIGVF